MMKFKFENKWSAKKTIGIFMATIVLAIAVVVMLDAFARAGDLEFVQIAGESFVVNVTDSMSTKGVLP